MYKYNAIFRGHKVKKSKRKINNFKSRYSGI